MKKLMIAASTLMVYAMKPFKLYAYTSGMGLTGRLIIQITSFFDFYITLIIGKNDILTLNQRVFRGNFILNRAIAKVDYDAVEQEVQWPALRKNILLGSTLNALGEGFAMNAPIIALGEPLRTQARDYLDTHHFKPEVMSLRYQDIQSKCSQILKEWVEGEHPTDAVITRSTITRLTLFLIEDILIPKKDAEQVTRVYLKSTAEIHLLRQNFSFLSGLNRSDRVLTREVHVPLRQLGVPNAAIDYTMFAAVLGVGSLFIQCVKDIQKNKLDFQSLTMEERLNLIVEAARLQPVVAGTHRIVETPEEVIVSGKKITLTGGDIVIYPLVCANTDEKQFKCPFHFDLNRSREERDKILSWSKGPHACPAKGLSVQIVLAMLNSLHEKIPLESIRY